MFCSSCSAEIKEGAAFCTQCGNKVGATTVPATTPADSDKLLVIAAHLGGIFFGFIPALVVYLIKKDLPGVVLDNAREALNWQITVILASVACFLLSFIVIGLFLFWVLIIANLVLCIVATIKSSNTTLYRYPFALRLIKAD